MMSTPGATAMNPLLERIAIDPRICGGKPCIKGTRIWVSLVLDMLADGMTEPELLADYPQLVHEDILAAIAYGAEVARERVVPVCPWPSEVKLKLDENIGFRGLELLQAAGHDVMTVRQQGLGGATDESLFATCADEGRMLITLDHDFGQVTRFHWSNQDRLTRYPYNTRILLR